LLRLGSEGSRMSSPTALLKLWCDYRPAGQVGPDLVAMAGRLDAEVNQPEVRKWFEAGPMSEVGYVRLRWVCRVLSNSTPLSERRLTWRERITGRLSQ
jgi:hypothetical protein